MQACSQSFLHEGAKALLRTKLDAHNLHSRAFSPSDSGVCNSYKQIHAWADIWLSVISVLQIHPLQGKTIQMSRMWEGILSVSNSSRP